MNAFRGTTDECLKHLAQLSQDPTSNHRRALEEFIGTSSDSTVPRWFKGNIQPEGEYLIRLRYFFAEKLGYHVTELERLSPVVRKAGKMFALRQKTLDELAHIFEYKTAGKRKHMLAVLRGANGLSPDKIKRVSAILDGGERAEHLSRELVAPVLKSIDRKQGEKTLLIETAARLVVGLTPIALFLLSSDCSEADRKQLHELVGADSVLELTGHLRRLCSETARNQRI
jgi:hypothetical protein